MSKFTRTRVETIEAVAFNNDEKTNIEIADLVGDQMEECNIDGSNILAIHLKKEKKGDQEVILIMEHSDWLVKDSKGVLSVVTPMDFEKEFSVVRE